jgi:hypothetical protein
MGWSSGRLAVSSASPWSSELRTWSLVDTWLSVTCSADVLLGPVKCWVPGGLVTGPEPQQEAIMIQSQGTFIFIAATVAVLVTVAAVVILQVRSRKRGPK